MAAERLGKARDVGGEEMVRHEIAHALEPERRQLRQDLALVRDARSEDVVEGRDAIGRDDEQVAADLVYIANFATPVQRQAGQGSFEERRHGEHGGRRLQQKV